MDFAKISPGEEDLSSAILQEAPVARVEVCASLLFGQETIKIRHKLGRSTYSSRK